MSRKIGHPPSWGVAQQREREDAGRVAKEPVPCATRGVVEFIECDDSSGHIECACGFVGRSVKVCWLRDLAAEHLGIDVETFKVREANGHPSVRWGG